MKNNNPVIDEFGTKYWYQNAILHRTDGPAIEYSNGTKYWYQNGELHRTDGPALECADGYKAWYYNGKHIEVSSKEEFTKMIKVLIYS